MDFPPSARYTRHRPEATLLHELVDQHYPPFLAALEQDGRMLPNFVQQEFEAYLKCGLLEHGFLRVRCSECHAERLVAFSCKRRGFCPSCGERRMVETAALLVDEVLPRQPLRQWVLSVPFPLRFLLATEPAAVTVVLGIVYRAIAAHLIRRAGLKQSAAQTGAVTLIQRFGSALNLNIHFHLLVLDGVYLRNNDRLDFRRVPPPTNAELDALLASITRRVGRHLQRRGWLMRDAESSHLDLDREATALDHLLSHSITYRIALGPRAGQKAFTLQSLPGTRLPEPAKPFLASADGFSLHAGVSAGADERKKVERLCRYIARPAIATGRLSLTGQGQIRYTLKTPYRDGTTHVVFEPLDFMARLAALVPWPRAHLTRYHGVFAPHSRWR
ncbi:MAG: transposase, partial [Gammaproteobacteria bacterium]